MPSKLTLEQFIERAVAVHGSRYGYSCATYERSDVPLLITCHVHGNFLQTPSNHLKGKGCPSCVVRESLPLEIVLSRFKTAHGDRYDYSRMVFHAVKKPVEIICKEHGVFWQTPDNHMRGKGCVKCRVHMRSSRDEFVTKAIRTHGLTYDYSSVTYVDSETKVNIACPTHGGFWQAPYHHLQGRGCPSCRSEMNGIRSCHSTEIFIAKARQVHSDAYLYGAVVYKNSKTKVEILCPIHGYFWQAPYHHLLGSGCPACTRQGFNPSKPAEIYVYQIINDSGEYAGFGITGSPISRHSRHAKSFRLSNSEGSLVYTRKLDNGAEAARIERVIKDSLPCVDPGVSGFKTEAVMYTYFDRLLSLIDEVSL